ncbi:MAG TPA: hypothetical protein VGX48_00545 [Pyrinomonadaceae bacterium]|jgi:hypothetical protein|nr:hypothetical protein [Pyrinomonadaceae bacterium]
MAKITMTKFLRKAAAFICLAVLTYLTLACYSLTGAGGSSVDAEARREAEKFWATQITKCGDSYYRKEVLIKKDGYVIYYQMKDPKVEVLSQPVSEADRLNGIGWKGSTAFIPKASRIWGTDKKGWYDWEKGARGVPDLNYGMGKMKGVWNVNTKRHWTREETSRYEPVDCSQIPQ